MLAGKTAIVSRDRQLYHIFKYHLWALKTKSFYLGF